MQYCWSGRCPDQDERWTRYIVETGQHVPEMRMSLISMGRLDDEGHSTSFKKGGWKIRKGALVMAKGPNIGTLCTLKTMIGKSNLAAITKD